MFRVIINRILLLAGLGLAAYAFGQLAPGTPVFDFKLPLFSEESGNRTWYLRGDKGTYVSATQIKVEGMAVSQYTDDEENREIAELTSPEAIYHHDSTTAFGPGQLRITTDTFEVVGNDWIWIGDRKEITFNKGVKVSLYQGIGDILK